MAKDCRKPHGKESVSGSNIRVTDPTGNDTDYHFIRTGSVDFNIFKNK
jgi:hypothetical protein